MTDAELARNTELLHRQWHLLRDWLRAMEDPTDPSPSVLPGWSVADLVAHLGRCLGALEGIEEVEPSTVPLAFGEYVAAYAAAADQIAETTRQIARDIADDPVPAVIASAERSLARLGTLGTTDRVVRARRGPILLSDMVVTRTVELVVHADDLARSVPGTRAPIDREALDQVAQALLDVVVARGGWKLEVVAPLTWVRLACGREPYDVDVLATALRAVYTSDSVPDLGNLLPLL